MQFTTKIESSSKMPKVDALIITFDRGQLPLHMMSNAYNNPLLKVRFKIFVDEGESVDEPLSQVDALPTCSPNVKAHTTPKGGEENNMQYFKFSEGLRGIIVQNVCKPTLNH